ncbi:hypothetical protein B484DRAFT_411407, partial [Ochromonadaceae sp. CCMP2298]
MGVTNSSGLVYVLIESGSVDVKLQLSDGADIDAKAGMQGTVHVTDLLNWNVSDIDAYLTNNQYEAAHLRVDAAMVAESFPLNFYGHFDRIDLTLLDLPVLDAAVRLEVAVLSVLDMSVALTGDVTVDTQGLREALLLGELVGVKVEVAGEASVAVLVTDNHMDAHLLVQEGGFEYAYIGAKAQLSGFEMGMPLMRVVVADRELMDFDMYMCLDEAAERFSMNMSMTMDGTNMMTMLHQTDYYSDQGTGDQGKGDQGDSAGDWTGTRDDVGFTSYISMTLDLMADSALTLVAAYDNSAETIFLAAD